MDVDPEQSLLEEAGRSVVMLPVERPTRIKRLNSQRMFFLASRVFWRRYLDYGRFQCGGAPACLQRPSGNNSRHESVFSLIYQF